MSLLHIPEKFIRPLENDGGDQDGTLCALCWGHSSSWCGMVRYHGMVSWYGIMVCGMVTFKNRFCQQMVERESCVDGMKNIPPMEFKHFPPCWSGHIMVLFDTFRTQPGIMDEMDNDPGIMFVFLTINHEIVFCVGRRK